MRLHLGSLCLILMCFSVGVSAQAKFELESGQQQVSILEVYSSQGCSSCPPAENWVNNWLTSDELWNSVIPMVFHVDYWDYLGWQDPFAQHTFSARQRSYKKQGKANAVYTPGFMLNGKEWRGWFNGKSVPSAFAKTGNLMVSIVGEDIFASFSLMKAGDILNIAVLGFGFNTYIEKGENSRKQLRQEFIVLSHKEVDPIGERWLTDWQKPNVKAKRYAIVAWVSSENSLTVKQAVGGFIPESFFSS